MGSERDSFGSIYERPGRGWWFRKREKGKSYAKYAGRTKAAAKRFQAKVWTAYEDGASIQAAIAAAAGEPPPSTAGMTNDQMFKQYARATAEEGRKKESTLARDRGRLNILSGAPWAADAVDRTERGKVRAWANKRLTDGAAAGTINNDLALASAAFRFAQDAGWIDDDVANPFHRARIRKVVRKRRPSFDLEEYQVFMAAAENATSPEAVSLLLAGGVIGWRLGELASLRCRSADLAYTLKGREAPVVRVSPDDEKEGATKCAFLVEPLLGAVTAAQRDRSGVRRHPSQPLFVQPNGTSWADPKRINLQIRKVLETIPDEKIPAWKKWGDAAHTPFTFHSLRHTCRSIMAHVGVSPYVIDAQVGHKNRAMSAMGYHYTSVPEVDLLDAGYTVARAFRGDRATSRATHA